MFLFPAPPPCFLLMHWCRYERRLKLYTEQLDKTRSVLEAEQKKILNEIVEICEAFDRKVVEFCDKRLVLEQQLLSRQLFLALTRLAVHMQVDSEEQLTKLAFDRLKLQQRVDSTALARDAFKVEYDAFREKQEQHVLAGGWAVGVRAADVAVPPVLFAMLCLD